MPFLRSTTGATFGAGAMVIQFNVQSAPKVGPAAAPGAPSCEAAISKAVNTMANPTGAAQPGMEAMATNLKGVFVKHCEADKWPAEVINCYAAATDMSGMKACRQKLPPEQAQAVQKDIMDLMMKAGGGGMAPPHGGAPQMAPATEPAQAGSGH